MNERKQKPRWKVLLNRFHFIDGLKSLNHLVQHNEIVPKEGTCSFHLNGHTFGFQLQNKGLKYKF